MSLLDRPKPLALRLNRDAHEDVNPVRLSSGRQRISAGDGGTTSLSALAGEPSSDFRRARRVRRSTRPTGSSRQRSAAGTSIRSDADCGGGGLNARLRAAADWDHLIGIREADLSSEDDGELRELANQLAKYYRFELPAALSSEPPLQSSQSQEPPGHLARPANSGRDANRTAAAQTTSDTSDKRQNQSKQHQPQPQPALAELPEPTNVSVLIISWYPPALKLSWQLNELDAELDANRLDFYDLSEGAQSGSDVINSFDLDLAIGNSQNETRPSLAADPNGDVDDGDSVLLAELRQRRELLNKALSCFQVTYNIINSQ